MSQPPPMPSQDVPSGRRNFRSILVRFLCDLVEMPRWHKGVLGAAFATLVLGWVHLGYRVVAATTQPAPSALGEWSRRVGASVLLGILIGWIFRTFKKIMTLLTALVLGGIVTLSYFNIANVDLTIAKRTYKDTSSWVTDQAGKLRHAAMGHIHSTLGGALGLFMGVRKKTPGL